MANYVSKLTGTNGTTYDVRELFPHVGSCSDAAATAAKTVTIGNFKLYTGAWVVVKFANTNTASVSSLTLNVDGTGAKSIKYKNANLENAGQLAANRYMMFVYDGSYYQIVGEFDPTAYLPLSGGTLTGRVTTTKFLNDIITGTGTAAQDKGSGVSPRYFPAKWTFNTSQTPTNGDIIVIKIPVAGHDYGVYLSIDNGTTYYPVVVTGTSRLTSHYPNGNYLALIFKSDGSAASMFPLAGGNDRVTVSGGVWQAFNYYDSGNTYDRTSQQTRIYAGGVGVFRYSICAMNNAQRMEAFTTTGDANGSPTTTKQFNTTAKFMYPPVIMYQSQNATYSNGSVIGNNYLYEQFANIDLRYSCNKTSSSGFAQYKPVYLECTLNSDNTFSITSNGLTQTFVSGKYYILLGCMYNTSVYQLALFAQHPMFYYDGTNLCGLAQFTQAEKTKLAGIAEGATKVEASSTNGKIKINGTDTTVYTHPTATAKSSGLYKITVDGTGHVTGAASVAKGDIPALDYVPNTTAGVSAAINLLGEGTSNPQLTDYYVAQYAGGNGTDPKTTSYHRRPISALWNTFRSLMTTEVTGSGNAITTASFSDDGNNRKLTLTKGATFLTSLPSHTHAYTVPQAITIQTGSSKQSHITLQTLMTWLITTKGYITSNAERSLILATSWQYSDNDILQLSIDGTNYELQLAGVIIEFHGKATDYQSGRFRLRIHSSPTTSFTANSGYTKFPVSHIAEYICNGSSYSPTWKMLIDRADISNGTSTTGNGTISVAGKAVSVYGLGSAAYTASTAYLPSTTKYAASASVAGPASLLAYGHSNEINFSGGKQGTCYFNYRDADTDAVDTGETPVSINYKFCDYRNSTAYTTITAANFAGNASSATTATNANNVYHTLTNPASETTYGVSFFSGISSGNKAMLTNDGIKHITREGSTSVSGYSIISMGNTIDNSTAGGKRGYVRLYGAGQYYAQLTPAAVTWSSNLDIYIPNKGGTMSVFGTVPGSDGKVIISDGTAGGIKASSYTIATSVPSGALFTDQNVRQSSTTTTNYRPILFGATNTTTVANLAATITGETYATTGFYIQPSSGNVFIASSTFGTQLTIERSGSANMAAIGFKNSNGMLGYVAANTVDGDLFHYGADTSKKYTILDSNNTSFTRSLTSGTKIGTIKIAGTSTDIYCQTNSNTTYTLGTSGNNVTLTPSSGSVQSITVPYATKAQYPMVAAGNEIRFFNNNEFTLDRHFWFGYQWADGSRYTPSGSDTPVTGDAALTAPNITKFIMGNCTQGGLASVHAKSFILGNGTDPTASSTTTTITTAATTGRTITLPDADGTVSLVGHTHSYAGSASAGGPATSVNTAAASDNVSRVVFFAYNGDTSKVVYDNDFKYNPSTNILTVGNVNGRLYYSGSSCSWWNDRDNAVIRVTTGDTGYRPLWSLLTATTGSWAMGNHTGDDLTFNFISKSVYDSKTNPSAYKQIKFTGDGDIKAQRYLYGTYLNISCAAESSSFTSSATILYCLNTSSDTFVRKASLSTIANAAIPAITETGTGTPADTDYYISQWANGSTSNPVNTTPVKRQHSALWAYINGKISATSSGSGNGVTSVSYANGVITYTKGSTFLTSHQSVSDKNVTLAWGTQKTIATIGSTDIHVTLPSNPNTNTTYTLGTSGDNVTLTPSSGSAQSITVPYATKAKYVYTDSIGSGAASHAAALQTYFNANKTTINRNATLSYYSAAESNGSVYMGYFLNGYNDTPYGGFFVAHYNTPQYVGISNGTYTQHKLISNQNYTDYTVKKDGTGATGSWGINITGNAATCTSASEMVTRFTAGTYGSTYALWWGADTTSTADTSNYARRNGTATIQFRSDTSGWTEIFLGNSTATGNAGSSTGWLGLYSDGTGCHHLSGLTTNSSATHYLPATSGTILNSGTTSFTQTLTSGTKIGEIKINDSSTNIYCSDANVTQTGVGSTYTNYRPLLISDSSSASAPPGAATVTGGTYITSSIYCQPSSGTVYASKFVGPLQGNADTATKAYTTVTSGTTTIARYGVVFAANSTTSGNESLCKSYDFRLNVTNGSTSAVGNCELVIGNGTPSGTAGNKQGYITLYSSGQGYHMIGSAPTDSGISHTFPASSGTILNTATGLQLSGGTMTGNLKMTEGKNFILRTHANNTYKAGIGYDTKGNECIALWALNKVTRLRWHAGTDMESMSSGTMMDVANPDFEITKADDQVNPKGFIGKGRIGTTDTLWTASTTGDTSVAIVVPNSATYLKVWLYNSTASLYTVHEVLIDTTTKTSAVIQTVSRGQSGFNLTLAPVTFSLTYTEAVTGAKKYTITVDVGTSIGIINGQYPVNGTQPTVKMIKIMACS